MMPPERKYTAVPGKTLSQNQILDKMKMLIEYKMIDISLLLENLSIYFFIQIKLQINAIEVQKSTWHGQNPQGKRDSKK